MFFCVSLLVLDKKCTYGIKCKFYHPERANQSYLSLADELREKAQISTGKEERNSRLSPRHLQSDPGSVHKAFTHPQDSDTEHISNQQSSSHPGQVIENTLLYWEDCRNSPVHVPCSVTGNQYQRELPGLHSVPNHYYANLDSGFGSYESDYYDFSQYLSNSHRLRPQQQRAFAGSRHSPVHVEKNNSSQSCRCCSQVVPSRSHQQHHGSLDSKDQPIYETCLPHMFLHNQHSLPSYPHYNEVPHHHQNYWSDPFQGLPQARGSLPSPVHSSHSHNSCCSYKDHQYHSWGHQQSSSAAFDPQRLELRKKLQAIFNPQQVDTVMEMFPHLMDAEKLAAKILNMKAQRGGF